MFAPRVQLVALLFFSFVISSVSVAQEQKPTAEPDEATVVPVEIVIPTEVLAQLTPDQKNLLETLRSQAQSEIQSIRNIKYTPPTSALTNHGQIIAVADLFQSPSNNSELYALSRDANGNKKELSPEQWTQLREEGLFVVPSERFPGQYHVWKISTVIQKGAKNITITLDKAKTFAQDQWVVQIPERFVGTRNETTINMLSAGKNIVGGIADTLSLILSLPSTKPLYSESQVVSILDLARAQYVKDALIPSETLEVSPQAKDELGFTPDLRLYNEELMEKVTPIVAELGDDVTSSYDKSKDDLERQIRSGLTGSGLSEDVIEQAVVNNLASLKQELLYQMISSNLEIEKFSPGLGALLVRNGRALEVILAGEEAIKTEVFQKRNELATELKTKYFRRAQSKDWLRKKVDQEVAEYYNQIRDQRYAGIVAKLHQAGFIQEAFFLKKNLEFITNHQDRLAQETADVSTAARTFTHSRQIWRPKKWIITQDKAGTYLAQRTLTSKVSSATPFWRYLNAWQDARANVKNSVYWLMYKNLLNGPIGLKAYFKKEPFAANPYLDQKTGKIRYGADQQQTMRTYLQGITEYVNDAKAKFEAKPDTGLFGKTFARKYLNVRLFVAEALGKAGVFGFQTVGTIANTALSTSLAATSVAWSPVFSLGMLGFNAVVYDTENPGVEFGSLEHSSVSPLTNSLVLRFATKGVAQFVFSLLGAGVVHPALGAGVWLAGETRAKVRTQYDSAWRKLMSTGLGLDGAKIHIPGDEQSLIVKRIKGPGLSRDYFYEVSPTLVTLALWARMESDTLSEYRNKTLSQILAPEQRYRAFVRVFGEFAGLESAKKQIESDKTLNSKERDQALSPLADMYTKLLTIPQSSKIKLKREDLEKTLQMSAALAEEYFTPKLEKMSELEKANFWTSRTLKPNDFVGLSQRFLTTLFSDALLLPQEDTDKYLRVNVDTTSIAHYMDSILTATPLKPLETYQVSVTVPEEKKSYRSTLTMPNARELCRVYLSRLDAKWNHRFDERKW